MTGFCVKEAILRICKTDVDPKIDAFHDLLMNGKYNGNIHDPRSQPDAATKNYVDNVTKKCYSGYNPILEDNFSILGFIASSHFEASG